jgi:hypothetical protein
MLFILFNYVVVMKMCDDAEDLRILLNATPEEGAALLVGRSRDRFPVVSLNISVLPTVALGSTQSLVKMSTRNIPGGKGGRCVRLTTSPPSCAECHENLRA